MCIQVFRHLSQYNDSHLIGSHRTATVAQIKKKLMLSKIKRCQNAHSLICKGLCSCTPVKVPMLTPVQARTVGIRTGPWSSERRWPDLMYNFS